MVNLLKKLGFEVLEDENRTRIDIWKRWYEGYVKEAHSYTTYNGKKKKLHKRARLCMAKRVCEDWANLLLNEKVVISTDKEEQAQRLEEILTQNKFRLQGNQLIEKTFALGTGAFVEFIDNNGVNIDYVSADKIFPISTENRQITECAFCSIQHMGGKTYYYLNIHVKGDNGYRIINKLFDERKRECELPEGVANELETGRNKPYFQIITPNITSNIDMDSVMGMSIYANSVDVLQALDVIFDSYRNEFILGKKRLFVSTSLLEREGTEDSDGVMRPTFDANESVYQMMGESEDGKRVIVETNMALRTQEHDDAMRQALNLLSDKSGFGSSRYTFDKSGMVKTATEVISEKSDMFQNLKKHELVLRQAICDMAEAVLYLDNGVEDAVINIDFDDSIIEDRKSEFSEKLQLLSVGILKPAEFRAWYMNETQEEAQKAIDEINSGAYPEE